ncbi:MAG: hypothetical protein ACRYF0_02715 [Janthinobacterium lividum]
MCTCKQKNKEAAPAYLKEKYGEKLKVGTLASLVNEAALKVDNQLLAVGFDEYEVWAMPVKKDGSIGNSKRFRVPILHTYCPHCGEKLAA